MHVGLQSQVETRDNGLAQPGFCVPSGDCCLRSDQNDESVCLARPHDQTRLSAPDSITAGCMRPRKQLQISKHKFSSMHT